MKSLDPVKLGPFTQGMDNMSPEYALPEGTVRDLVNTEVTKSGTLKRRKGYDKTLSGSNITAAWSNGNTGYIVDAGVLYVLAQDASGGITKTAITNSVGANFIFGAAFADTPLGIVVSDTFNLFYIDENTLHYYNATPPQILSTSGGSDGVFLLATTVLLDSGIESQPSEVQKFTGSYPLVVTATASSNTAYLYASELNGMTLYRVGEITAGTAVVNSGVLRGVPLGTHGLAPIPAGTTIRFKDGRLWSVQNNNIFYSEPFYYNLYNPIRNVYVTNENITTFEMLDAGILVATQDVVYMMRGNDPSAMELGEILPIGIVPGTLVFDDKSDGYLFMTKLGLHHIDNKTGEITPLHHDKVAVQNSNYGAAGMLVADGVTRAITSLYDGAFSGTVANSFMDAEIVREGIVL